MDFDNDQTESKLHAKRLGRELAMQFLFQCEMNGVTPEMGVWQEFFEEMKAEHGLRDNRYARKGREYAEFLFTNIVIHQEEIDGTIRTRSENWEFERLSPVDRNLMRIAVCEMLFDDSVPPVVSINEAVEIAMDYSGDKSGAFINGVLNGVKDTLNRPAREGRKAGETK